MKLTTLLFASLLALPLAGSAADNVVKDDAHAAWDATKNAATRTGQMVENGAAKAGRIAEHGVQKSENIIQRTVEPTPRVTLNEGGIITPGTVPVGSDLVVRNRGDAGERFQIRGHGINDRVFVAPGQSKRLDLDLPRGNYEVMSSDGGMTHLRVR